MKEAIFLPVDFQSISSIAVTPFCNTREEDTEWTHEIENYLETGELPEKSKHAHKV